tara:strand:+ start:2723 stop:3796 length:1074 start_codon:yes stop_codon:yes gene_type:complete
MSIRSLITAKSELTHSTKAAVPVVLSTRIRLARNLKAIFPGRAEVAQREAILSQCQEVVGGLPEMKGGASISLGESDEIDQQALVERHLVSPELLASPEGAGVVISKNQACSIMINEEDHLRIQMVKTGFHFKKVWKAIDTVDTEIEKQVDYAFSPDWGYLTACPTNLGTGMRASVMMHLPGLVIAEQMEKVVKAVNQLGLAVRGLFGEGSDASGSIFQISNQQTLGESEEDIIKRLTGVLNTVIEQEQNARQKLLEDDRMSFLDKIGRAYGILTHSYYTHSGEAMNFLSLMRLAVDLGILPEDYRAVVDRLFIECQPAHIQLMTEGAEDPKARDAARAVMLRDHFGDATLNFDAVA